MRTNLFIAGPTALALALAPSIPLPGALLTTVGLGITLSGCNTPTIDPQIIAFANQVAALVQQGCGYLPLISDIEALIPVYGQSAVAIETAICAAVKATSQGKPGARVALTQVTLHTPQGDKIVHFVPPGSN